MAEGKNGSRTPWVFRSELSCRGELTSIRDARGIGDYLQYDALQ